MFLVYSCTSTKSNNDVNMSLSYPCSKQVKASHYISPTKMVLEEDNVVEMTKRALILDLVSETDDSEKTQQEWNMLFYKDLPHHYLVNETITKAGTFLNDSSGDLIDSENWPLKITQEEYESMYKAVSLDLVASYEVPASMKGKYVITPNKDFWDMTTDSDYPLLVDVLSTYERSFEPYELIHDNENSAIDYAIIIFDALCNQRNPDNLYYYNKLVLEQIPRLSQEVKLEFLKLGIDKYTEFPFFNLNYYSKDRKAEYDRIFESQREDLDFTKNVYTKLPNPPFFIVKVKA